MSPLFDPSASAGLALRLQPAHDGIAGQLSDNSDDELDVIIGLDFGTSSIKVVIRDTARRAFAIPFFAEGVNNPYLLPARLYQSSDCFSLDTGDEIHRDLKLRLIAQSCSQNDLRRSTAFLALVIRHCRGWLLSEQRNIYANTGLIWGLNLGLPAASYEDRRLVERFRLLALAAANLASDPSPVVTLRLVDHYLDLAESEFRRLAKGETLSALSCMADMVDVVPEIAAQIFGYVRSERWDRRNKPMMMMVDVGAGTVDAAIFSVTKEKSNPLRFNFFANNVQLNGVMNLHRTRVEWLKRLLKDSHIKSDTIYQLLDGINFPTDRLVPIPDSVTDYITGLVIHVEGNQGGVDRQFYHQRYLKQLNDDTILYVKRYRVPHSTQWSNLPFFLCGGGRRMTLYRQFMQEFDTTKHRSIGLEPMQLTRPQELLAPGLREEDYDRLSVAYGLSYQNLGEYVRTSMIPNLTHHFEEASYRDVYISKDLM